MLLHLSGQDNSVSVATCYGLDGPGIESQTSPGAHTASYKMGSVRFPGVKWLGRGIDHPP
jgi:hypothetical protein